MELITTCVRSVNGNRILLMEGDRQSFRCRQRNKINGERVPPMRFVSYKEMEKEIKKYGYGGMNGYNYFNTLGKL